MDDLVDQADHGGLTGQVPQVFDKLLIARVLVAGPNLRVVLLAQIALQGRVDVGLQTETQLHLATGRELQGLANEGILGQDSGETQHILCLRQRRHLPVEQEIRRQPLDLQRLLRIVGRRNQRQPKLLTQGLGDIQLRHQAQLHQHLADVTAHFLLRHECALDVTQADLVAADQQLSEFHSHVPAFIA